MRGFSLYITLHILHEILHLFNLRFKSLLKKLYCLPNKDAVQYAQFFRFFCEGRRERWSPVSAAFMVLETSVMVQKTLVPDVGV